MGICSTSHGDFVCVGCKRFFHEVRDWQNFTPAQRDLVWNRLAELKRACILTLVGVADEQLLKSRTDRFVVEHPDDQALRIYEAVVRCGGAFSDWGLVDPGIEPRQEAPQKLLESVDEEFFSRSKGLFDYFYSRNV